MNFFFFNICISWILSTESNIKLTVTHASRFSSLILEIGGPPSWIGSSTLRLSTPTFLCGLAFNFGLGLNLVTGWLPQPWPHILTQQHPTQKGRDAQKGSSLMSHRPALGHRARQFAKENFFLRFLYFILCIYLYWPCLRHVDIPGQESHRSHSSDHDGSST